MPSEKFYRQDSNPDSKPDLTVAWGDGLPPQVLINGNVYDRSGLNRLIRSLRRARNQVYGVDE